MQRLGSVMHIMPISVPKIRVIRNRYRAEGVRRSHDGSQNCEKAIII